MFLLISINFMHKYMSISMNIASIKLLECSLFIELSDKTSNTIFNLAKSVKISSFSLISMIFMHKDISICVKLTSIKLLECSLFIESSDKTLNTIFNWANNVSATLFIVSGYPETLFKSKIQSGIHCHPHLRMPDDYVIPNLQVFCRISEQISGKIWYLCHALKQIQEVLRQDTEGSKRIQ